MNIISQSLRRPLTVVVLVLAICLGGSMGVQKMARDIFPPLGIPTIYVAQPFGGMDPAQVEGYLTYFYEYHFLYIAGIEHVESKNIQGASIMKLQFHPGTDMSAAMAETVAYVNRARAFMPPGTPGPFITRFDAGSVAVGHLVFSTENPGRTVGQMQDAALNMVRPLFATLQGVSAPPPFGGGARTMVINIKPDRMRALGLSPDDIVKTVAQSQVVSPSGNMNLGDRYPIVLVNALAKNIKDLETVPVRVTPAGAVLIRDVATVDDQSDIVTSYALVNGRRTVYMPVTKRSDASTLAVVELVKRNLAKFQAAVPDDVKVTFEFDQTPVVLRAIKDLTKEGAIGAVLTGLMVLLFLRDWRSAVVVVLNIPIALLAACFALWITGQSIHLMTLGGLALAVGVLVDEATVAIENIHEHLARGVPLARAALDATRETSGPRLLAMLCIVAVFTPALFMTGAAKALFTPLALAVGFSMLASFLLSSTLVPILAIWFLKRTGSRHTEKGVIHRAYSAVLRPFVAIRWIVVPVYLALAVSVLWIAGGRIGLEIFPKADAGQVALRVKAAPGTKLEITEKFALRALDLIAREAGAENIALTMGLVGVHASNYPVNFIHLWNSGPDEAWLAVQFRQGSHVRVEAFQEKLRSVFANELPGATVVFEPSDIVTRVMSFGANQPVEVAVNGPDLSHCREHAEKILTKLKAMPELRDVQIAQSLDYPSVEVDFNRLRAGLAKANATDLARALVSATTSSRFTQPLYWNDPKTGVSYSVQVQIPQALTQSLEDLRNTPVKAEASTVLLRNIAQISQGTTIGQYERYNMARVVSVTANLYKADLGSVTKKIERALAEIGAPPAKTTVAIRGQAVPLNELLDGFRSGLMIAVTVIFLLLAANFQSFRLSLAVLSTVPAVLAGVVAALWLTGTTLNIQSAIGSIMAVGVAVANAILLVTFAERSHGTGVRGAEAAVTGAVGRLRPVLMTSFAMIAGMLPMALGLGDGGEQTAPLGRAVVGGLVAATLATLFVLPTVFALVRNRPLRRSVSIDPDDPSSTEYAPVTSSAASNPN